MSGHDRYCLIVDDSRVDRSKLRKIAKKSCHDHKVVTARSMQEAMEHVRQQHVAIMFLENDLPDGHGADMAQALEANDKYENFPVVLFKDNPTPFMFAKAESTQNVCCIWDKSDFTVPSVERVVEKHALPAH
jgi:DNA-binding LytR/AlgR family response regulator